MPSPCTLPPTQATVVRTAGSLTTLRVLIGLGLVLLGWFLWWFADRHHIGYAPLFWPLCISLFYKVLRLLYEWYHYAAVSVAFPSPAAGASAPVSVDMLTTACPSEPREMIVRTLEAMQRIRYPHTSYLCDEGDDPWLRQACARLGVRHVTRQHKVDAKAGNINHALRQATGEICVILDPDHEPTPDFLEQVLPFFADPGLGFVQVVQAYGNQHQSLVARGAAEQTYHFYGPLMMGMNAYGTVQAIGANCTFRRRALDSIGGHAAGLTEDMHTAMRLHAAGWRSAYLPVIVSRGLVPVSLAAFYAQQLKWSRGCFELLLHVYPRLFRHFTWAQRIHYLLLPLYFLSGLITLLDVSIPLLGLVLHRFPWHLPLGEFLAHMAPVLVVGLLIRVQAQRWLREPGEAGLHVLGGLLRTGTWWVYLLGLVYTLLRIRVPYLPTPKQDTLSNAWRLSLPNIALLLAAVTVSGYGLLLQHDRYGWLLFGLAAVNLAGLLAVVVMGQQLLLQRLTLHLRSVGLVGQFARALGHGRRALYVTGLPWLRRHTMPVTGLLLLVTLCLHGWHLFAQRQQQHTQGLQWLSQGPRSLLLGRSYPPLRAGMPLLPQSPVEGPERLVHWYLTARQLPALTPAIVARTTQTGSTVLISWRLRSATDTSWVPCIRQLARSGQPVLLRPILPAMLPALTHQQCWNRLATITYGPAGSRAVLVWTVPRDQAPIGVFPGRASLHWLALEAVGSTTMYRRHRSALAHYPELHQLPVMVLTHASASLADSLRYFPEIKSVVLTRLAQERLMAHQLP